MAEKYGKKTKELMVKEMNDVFSKNKGFVFSSVNNVKASDIDVLRKKMRQSGSKYMVLKNRLAKIALEEVGIKGLSGTIQEKHILGIGIVENDPVQVAKLMVEFSKDNKGFEIMEGYLEGRVVSKERVKELAALPGREQLLAIVVGTLNAPITAFVGVLSAISRSVVCVLNAIKEKKEKQGQ